MKLSNIFGFVSQTIGRSLFFLPEKTKINLFKKEFKTNNKLIKKMQYLFSLGLFSKYKGTAFIIKEFSEENYNFKLKIPFNSYMSKRYFFDRYDFEFVDLLNKFLKKSDTYVDIGANVGLTTLLGSCFSDNVIAFEPIFIEQFNANMRLNNKNNIKLFTTALSDHGGFETMYLGIDDRTNTCSKEGCLTSIKNYKNTKKIPTRKFDDLNIKADFVKIDVDGYEYEVLKGMEELLKHIRYIYCEVHCFSYLKVNQLLEKHGFKYDKIEMPNGKRTNVFYYKEESSLNKN